MLDWNDITEKDRRIIIERVKNKIPIKISLDYSSKVRKYFLDNEVEEARDFFEDRQKESEKYNDRHKPNIDKDSEGLYVEYSEVNLDNIENSQLYDLYKTYDFTPLEEYGYDGVKFGDEIVVFKSNQIKSIHNKGTYSKTSNKITENEH